MTQSARVEIGRARLPAVVPVAALVRAAVTADAVDGRAAGGLQTQRRVLGHGEAGHGPHRAGGGNGGAAISVGRHRLGFDADVGVSVNRQSCSVRDRSYRPTEGRQERINTVDFSNVIEDTSYVNNKICLLSCSEQPRFKSTTKRL